MKILAFPPLHPFIELGLFNTYPSFCLFVSLMTEILIVFHVIGQLYIILAYLM